MKLINKIPFLLIDELSDEWVGGAVQDAESLELCRQSQKEINVTTCHWEVVLTSRGTV